MLHPSVLSSPRQTRRFVVCSTLLGIWALPGISPADAQQRRTSGARRPNAPAMAGANIYAVEANTLATLPNVLAANRADAVSLGVSLSELQAAGAASAALMQWVREGGVVFLRTDAARLFGYRTVRARESTPRQAGQLFGRAKAALPFGGHPLLWGAAAAAANANGGAGQSTLRVRRVFYRMQPGDHLVIEHPAGVPLLRVSDLAAPDVNALFAVAVAPFGRGWAVFTPDFIEPNRGDGSAFVRNLMRLVSSSAALRRSNANVQTATPDGVAPLPSLLPQAEAALCSVPASAVEQLAKGLRNGPDAAFLPALSRLCAQALSGPVADGRNPAAAEGFAPRLMIARGEAAGLGAVANAGAANEAARDAAVSMLLVWRARLELQRDNLESAREWMEMASRNAAQGAEIVLWSGIVDAGMAEDLTLSSRQRGALYAQAATRWGRALTARPLLPRAQVAPTAAAQSTLGALSGVPLELVRGWTVAARAAANMMSVEPPLVTLAGNRGNAMVVRHFADDPTLRFAVPIATTLANNAGLFGWRADEEEILIFPNADYFQAYRQSAGLNERMRPNPLARFGDIVGSRILMVSQITLPVLLPPAQPGGPRRVLQLGSAVPAVLGRLHAQVLVNSLTQDGVMAPEWMTLGLVALSNQTTVADPPSRGTNEALRRVAAGGGLLAPRQFENVPVGAENETFAELQAQRLMAYFYARFGAGGVTETLQRLGSGQSIDEAMLATTALTETQFFLAWREAELGANF